MKSTVSCQVEHTSSSAIDGVKQYWAMVKGSPEFMELLLWVDDLAFSFRRISLLVKLSITLWLYILTLNRGECFLSKQAVDGDLSFAKIRASGGNSHRKLSPADKELPALGRAGRPWGLLGPCPGWWRASPSLSPSPSFANPSAASSASAAKSCR